MGERERSAPARYCDVCARHLWSWLVSRARDTTCVRCVCGRRTTSRLSARLDNLDIAERRWFRLPRLTATLVSKSIATESSISVWSQIRAFRLLRITKAAASSSAIRWRHACRGTSERPDYTSTRPSEREKEIDDKKKQHNNCHESLYGDRVRPQQLWPMSVLSASICQPRWLCIAHLSISP